MLYIHSIGHFHPENIIDNTFLEKLEIETNHNWIMERVGIRERRTVLSLNYIKETYNKNPMEALPHIQHSNAAMGSYAARMALERANLLPEQIGMVIAGTCSPHYSVPAEACAIAALLGIRVLCLDINSSCSTFAAQMNLINHMHDEALPDYILLVIPESMTRSVNYSDRKVAVLWGDGAAAVIISKKNKSSVRVLHTTMNSNPESWSKVVIPTGGHFYQDGSHVQKYAIRQTLSILSELRDTCQIKNQHYFIGHQANLVMLESICKMANISKEKHLYNVDTFGNSGAAGAPCVLSQHWSHFVEGDTLLLAVVGAGLSWGGMVLQFS